MYEYLKNVKSGDSTNMEGIAAQYYWRYLINPNFLRERYGDSPNQFFNFGYSVLRSIVARALVETGLLPVFGIFHKNKYNPYCLADDVMEPYRPFVDLMVIKWLKDNPSVKDLTKEAKAYFLRIATKDTKIGDKIRPILVAVKQTTSSLYKCYLGEKRLISYPQLL